MFTCGVPKYYGLILQIKKLDIKINIAILKDFEDFYRIISMVSHCIN